MKSGYRIGPNSLGYDTTAMFFDDSTTFMNGKPSGKMRMQVARLTYDGGLITAKTKGFTYTFSAEILTEMITEAMCGRPVLRKDKENSFLLQYSRGYGRNDKSKNKATLSIAPLTTTLISAQMALDATGIDKWIRACEAKK